MKKQKHTKEQNQISMPKKIITVIIEIIIILLLFFLGLIAWTKYKHSHHGYDSSPKVIKTFITSWGNNYTSNIITCFSQDSATYKETINDILQEEHDQIKIKNEDIEILEENKSDEITKEVKESTKLQAISNCKLSTVKIHTINNIDGTDYNYQYIYDFITYRYNDKWFIESYNLEYAKQLNKTSEDDIQLLWIGDKDLGYIQVPTKWVDNTSSEESDIIINEISSISPTKDAIITLDAISPTISKTTMINNICYDMDQKGLTYTIDTQKLSGYDATRITGIKNKMSTIIYVLKTPLVDNYVHTITLNCYIYDAEYYHDTYIKSYTLRK